MKVAVAGAGAIGAYVGALLSRAGCDVTLIARGPHARPLAQHGVRVQSINGDFEARPRVVDSPAATGAADVVFLGVKAHSLPALAPAPPPPFEAGPPAR